jgi:AcrR family transcriptional regulator
MKISLKTRKQQMARELVRDAIFDAAMDLFASKGFNETTIEEIVEAAGVSPRSFYRYFPTKSEVLAYDIIGHGDVLVGAVEASPANIPALEVVRRTAHAGIHYAMSRARTRLIMEISAQNMRARQAHRAARVEVEDRVSRAFAARIKYSGTYGVEPRLLTMLTLNIVDLALNAWFNGEVKDWETALTGIFDRFTRLFCGGMTASTKASATTSHRKRALTRTARELIAR